MSRIVAAVDRPSPAGAPAAHPGRGDTIQVYRSGDRWHSPQERSTYGLVGGIGALLLFGLLTVGWFRVRRRGSLDPR